MLKTHWQLFSSLMLAAELLLSAALFVCLLYASTDVWIPAGGNAGSLLVLGAIGCAAWPIALRYLGLHQSQRRTDVVGILPSLTTAGFVCTLIVTASAFVLSAPVAPNFPLLFGSAQFLTLTLLRVLVLLSLRQVRRSGRNYRNILVVGTGPRAHEVRQSIEVNPSWGLRVIGYVDDYEVQIDERDPMRPVHKLADLPTLFRDHVIDEVIIAYPRSMLGDLGPVVHSCAQVGVPLTMLSDIFGDFVPPPRVGRFGPSMALTFAPVHHSSFKLGVKRAIDIVGSAAALIALAPAMALAALAIRASSPGPIFFRQTRCGLNGRPFEIYKLRTMVADAEQRKAELAGMNEIQGPVFKMRNDPRVTAVGRVLRRWSLDETPQFWNVLKGDMSLVGPRPPVPTEVALYENGERRRLSMRPGLTCFWQIRGRSQIDFSEWVRLDVEYIDNWSLSLDLEILLRTIPAVLGGEGAS